MDSFAKCPLRFYGSSVIKDIPWRASKAKARGTTIHSNVEKCLRLGWQPNISWDSHIDLDYVRRRVDEVQTLRATHELHIEKEMAIDKQGRSCGWWDDNGLLRAKADAMLIPKNPNDVLYVLDIKTGKRWDDEDFQLRVECLLAHLIWQVPQVQYEYWYVDEGETHDGVIDFRNGLGPVQDVYDLMRDMLLALKNNNFPAKRNKFCKWCDYYGTPKCR